MRGHACSLLVTALTLAPLHATLLAQDAAGQTAATQPTRNIELAPIACFWRTSTDAVRVGEHFTLVLTCNVLDTAAATVLPDQSRLDPGALQLPPFEVVGGQQPPDLRSATHRIFQYQYDLRYLGEDAGRDVQIPALTLTYRVQSRVRRDSAAVESRERQFILPAHTIRIESIVPASTRDIREVAPVSLAQIDAQRSRATMLRIAAWGLYAVSALVALWTLVNALKGRRAATVEAIRHISDGAVLNGALSELSAVRRAKNAEGWTDALAARALAALRIGASYAASMRVTQTPASAKNTSLSGQLRLTAGWLRRTPILVSGAATTEALARARQQGDAPSDVGASTIETLEDALLRFSRAVYGRDGLVAADELDTALAAAENAIRAVRRRHTWLALRLRALRQWMVESARTRGWARS